MWSLYAHRYALQLSVFLITAVIHSVGWGNHRNGWWGPRSGIPLSGRGLQTRSWGQTILFRGANVNTAWSSDEATRRPPEIACMGGTVTLLLGLTLCSKQWQCRSCRYTWMCEMTLQFIEINAVMLPSDREIVTYSTLSIMGERSLSFTARFP